MAAGLVAGLALGLAASRLFQHQLYGVGATDPPTYGGVALALAAAALAACLPPARRAARIDPARTLQEE